jgi:hypothetical protein
METLHASRVEKWIRAVKQWFLDAAPIKCVVKGSYERLEGG